MSNVLDNAKKHFKDKLNGELKKLVVPEWKTDIYYKDVNSFAVESRVIQLQQQGLTVEALVESIIAKSLNPEGKPFFNKMDKWTLMNETDPAILIRIAGNLNQSIGEYSIEQVTKN